MDNKRIIEILDALIDGYSPTTGESLKENEILKDKVIITALTLVTAKLKESQVPDKRISAEDISKAIEVFKTNDLEISTQKLRQFFAGIELSESYLNEHDLFGKYANALTASQIDYSLMKLYPKGFREEREEREWDEIDLFEKTKFNYLNQHQIQHYINSVEKLALVKNKSLSDHELDSRKSFKRAYEPWLEGEVELLKEVIKKTNDLVILSDIFQRSLFALQAQVKKTIYEDMKNQIDCSDKRQNDQNNNDDVDIFEKQKFNHLTQKQIDKYTTAILDLGLVEDENLSTQIKNSRKINKRAYEPWFYDEVELLRDIINYTNDLKILSQIFFRTTGAIRSKVKKIISGY